MNRQSPYVPLQQPINFAHPDFAMRCFDSSYIISYDRGKSWEGRYSFPKFPTGRLTSRTDYLISGSNTCTVFLSAEEKGVQVDEYSDRAFCARTTDGGLSWHFLGWITGEPIGVRSVMPATVRVSDSHLVSALRRRIDRGLGGERPPVTANWIDAYESEDNGTTWNFLSKVGDTDLGKRNGNPPAMVRLGDGRLVVAYGYRGIPYGIRARISKDNGATWGDIIHLREDAATWDMGYCRMIERPDGKLVTIYYYNTPERTEQHIAATIWDPGAVQYSPKPHGPELKVWAVPSAQKIFREDDQPAGAAAASPAGGGGQRNGIGASCAARRGGRPHSDQRHVGDFRGSWRGRVFHPRPTDESRVCLSARPEPRLARCPATVKMSPCVAGGSDPTHLAERGCAGVNASRQLPINAAAGFHGWSVAHNSRPFADPRIQPARAPLHANGDWQRGVGVRSATTRHQARHARSGPTQAELLPLLHRAAHIALSAALRPLRSGGSPVAG